MNVEPRKLIRWVVAAVCVMLGLIIAFKGPEIAFLASLALFGVATLLMIHELTYPLTWLVDAFFGTGVGGGDKPPLDLRLARHYIKQGRLEDALDEYLRVMEYHPHVAETYEQAIILTAELDNDREAVEKLFEKGKRHLKEPEDQGNLLHAFNQAKEKLGGYAR
ncbi:MAG: hypothetical protein AAF585_11955 [Verrucomicrobiota bacterium]